MSQATEHWSAFAAEFYRDGSLRDIYLKDTQLDDWNIIAQFVLGHAYPIAFSGAWSSVTFPPDIARLFPKSADDELTLLEIDVSGVRVCCHFFTEQEIEFDLDPSDVDTPYKLDAIFHFMKGLAAAIGKDAVLTPENMPDTPIFRCRPDASAVEHTPLEGSTQPM
jgi:hypothetical protein